MATVSPDFVGRVAIVTGGSRGIGAAIAKGLAAGGARVLIAARKVEGAQSVAQEIAESGGQAQAVAAHVGKREDAASLVHTAVARFGQVDILINNAGTNPHFGALVEATEAAWDKTFEVNLKGPFWAARELISHLRGRGAPGAIVNIASVAGLKAAPMQGVYGMTKAALISLTQTLAFEVAGSGIRVNAIAPGLVDTRLASAIVKNDLLRDAVISRTPLGRHAVPNEIVGAALFLASDAASYVTGHVLVVDGGMMVA